MKSKLALLASGLLLAALSVPASGGRPDAVSYKKSIAPLFTKACIRCHASQGPAGGLALDSKEGILKGGTSGVALVKGKAKESLLVVRISPNDPKGRKTMPKGGKPLSQSEIKLVSDWINQGAKFD